MLLRRQLLCATFLSLSFWAKKKSADFTNKTKTTESSYASYATTTSRKWLCLLAAFTINSLCSYCSKTKIMISSCIKETWYEHYIISFLQYQHIVKMRGVFLFVSVCGDDVCELEENCLNCPADCGICPMSITIKVAIALPVALFSTGFILTMVVSQCNTHTHTHARNRRTCFMCWCLSNPAVAPVPETEDVLGWELDHQLQGHNIWWNRLKFAAVEDALESFIS